jgi:hypothetical protein
MTKLQLTERRDETKRRIVAAAKLVQVAHDNLVMAKAAATSSIDHTLNEALKEWRSASRDYSQSLDDYTRTLGPGVDGGPRI